jgi:parallel beta-helix repeat protein
MKETFFVGIFLIALVSMSTILFRLQVESMDVSTLSINARLSTRSVGAVKLPVHNVNTGLDYATIQEAILATQTLDGHTIQVESGVYYENLVINKSLSIIGEDAENTTMDGGGTGDVVSVEDTNVTISGFTVRNSGPENLDSGIKVDSVFGAIIKDNCITHCRDGVQMSAFGGHCQVKNNQVSNCTGHGIYVSFSYHNTIEGNTLTGNNFSLTISGCSDNLVTGNNLTRNSKGLYLYIAMDNVVTKNVVSENDEWGLMLIEYSDNNTITDNDIEGNGHGIYCMDSSDNVFHHNRLDNINQVYLSGYSASSNVWYDPVSHEGNFWSDYTGTDTDGNGIGDSSYYVSYDCHDDYPLVLVAVDQALVSHAKCDVGSNEQVFFHVGPHPNNRTSLPLGWTVSGSSLVDAYVRVNGTEYITNRTGWIGFNVTSSEPETLRWASENSYQNVENPSIEWTASSTLVLWQILNQWWYIIAAVILGSGLIVVKTRPKRLETPLQSNEYVVKQFLGGRVLIDAEKPDGSLRAATFSSGRWFITNQRLIYEGKIQSQDLKRSIVFPGWMKTTPEVLVFPLDKLKSAEVVDGGLMKGKYILAAFEENGQKREAMILTRKKEHLLETLRKASDSSVSNSRTP